jgi:hypothetical protein
MRLQQPLNSKAMAQTRYWSGSAAKHTRRKTMADNKQQDSKKGSQSGREGSQKGNQGGSSNR